MTDSKQQDGITGGRGSVVFVGSFDPFHEGHESIVRRALLLFDSVAIGVSVNPEKHYSTTAEERVESIREIFRQEKRVIVEVNDGLTIDFARRHSASYIIKGVRNTRDFEYEQKQALWNKRHGGIETLLLCAEEGMEELSSTSIRERNRKQEIE